LEGDALEVVTALRQEGPSWSKFGQLIADARSRLNSFQSWEPCHVRRAANEVAHRLAKAARDSLLMEFGWDRVPLLFKALYLLSKIFLINFLLLNENPISKKNTKLVD
jgi:hypothetical protein